MVLAHLVAVALTLSPRTGNICTTQACVVYAQTGTDLYQIDPVTLVQTHLCTFSGTDAAVFDIAVDGNGNLFAVTSDKLYQVNPSTCASTYLATVSNVGSTFNGLSFLLDGRLIAVNVDGVVAQIDTSSGAVTQLGSYGGNLGSSGDAVALANGDIYATAIDNSGAITDDILVKLDPNNGFAATRVGTITGYSQIYGLGYWAGILYGFDAAGDVLKIDPATGAATVAINNSFQWFGAGTTPNAPTSCTNNCSSGSTSCSNSGDLLSCQLQSNGCYDWAPSSCGSNQTCSNGACVATCSDACFPFTTDCSDGTHVESCQAQANGCFDWTVTACPANQVCSSGSCAPSCSNTCSPGQAQCSGSGVQTCEQQSNGCYDWSTATACNQGEICSGGVCGTSCTDACTAGAVQCGGDYTQNCVTGASGCLEWQSSMYCGANGCSNGQCCDCAPGDARCDASGNVEVCTADANSAACPSWQTTACASGACQAGVCLVGCAAQSEVNNCPNGSQCLSDGSGTYCGYSDGDGGFIPVGASSAGTSSGGTTTSGGATSTTSSTTTSTGGATTAGSGTTTTSTSGGSTGLAAASGGTTSGASGSSGASGGSTGGSAKAGGADVTTAGCGCSAASPGSTALLAFGLLALLGARRRARG